MQSTDVGRQIRSPSPLARVPREPLRLRLTTSAALRRPLPTQMVLAAVQARAARRWDRDPSEHHDALEAMETIVGGTSRSGELGELARAYFIEHAVQEALFWQPWKLPAMSERSAAHARAALAGGRGVLASACHLGPFFLTFWPIAEMRHVHTVMGPWLFAQATPDYWGRRLARWRKGLEAHEEEPISSQGVYGTMRDLLAHGEAVMMFFDLPGSRTTRFLGKPVTLATGTARAAVETDSLVLPLAARREGHRVWVDAHAPLDPRSHDSFEGLHDALAAVHERWILERPQALEDPRRRGAWEEGASAHGWARTRPSSDPS